MLTPRQNEIVTGSLLGDGYIWNNFMNGSLKFQVGQSKLDHSGTDKIQYLSWFANELKEFGVFIKPKKQKIKNILKRVYDDREFLSYVFSTRANKLWNDIERRWYVERQDHRWFKRRKIVPRDIHLTPLTLCIWYMDDGSNCAKDANIMLETQGFTEEEVKFLINRLDTNLGIKSKLKWTSRNGYRKPRIYVGRKSYFDFIEMIKPHIAWNCFAYKVDTSKYNKIPHRGETHSLAKLTEEQVKDIIAMANTGVQRIKIAKYFNIDRACVSMILSGKRWAHVTADRPEIRRRPRITVEQRAKVLSMKDKTQTEIASELGIHQTTVSRILKKESNAKY